MKYTFIVNPQARDGELQQLWQQSEPHFTRALRHLQVYFPKSAEETRSLGRIAASEGNACVVAVGGEGTMNRVMQGILDSGKEGETLMGLVPFGNVNDYATNIGMDKSWEAALRTLQAGHERRVGLTQLITPRANEYALNIADIGFGASTAKRHSVDHELRWFKGQLKYNLLAMKNLLGWRNVPARVTVDNEQIDGEVAIALAGYSPTLGGFHLLPHADVYGDQFAVTIGRNASRMQILQMVQQAKRAALRPSDQILFRKASRVVIEPMYSHFVAQVDGEISDTQASRIEFISHPRRLRFLVPAQA